MSQQIDLFLDAGDLVDDRDCWRTPSDLLDPLRRRFNFAIDLAADPTNAVCPRYFTADDDALSREWPIGCWCFLNPPFSMLSAFMEKVHAESNRGVRVVVVMPGHRHEQSWFHNHVLGVASEIIVPVGRVAYVAPPGIHQSGPAFPSLVAVYGLLSFNGTIIRSIVDNG